MTGLKSVLTKMLLVSLVMATSRAVSEIAKPGCKEECGGVQIPFPFGIGPGYCYINDTLITFQVRCDNSSGTEVPLIGLLNNRTLLSISIEDNSLRVSSVVAYQCYKHGLAIDGSSSTDGSSSVYDMRYYNISSTKNMLVGIGCDAAAVVQDFNDTGSMVGCITSCSLDQPAKSGRCPGGHGCCAVSIFNTMFYPNIIAKSEFNYTREDVGGNNHCSAAFITEAVNGSYDFSADLLKGSTNYTNMRVPVVYNWYVTAFGNCMESVKNGTYNCGSNTRCVDYLDYGFSCQCLDGYTGNPYLANGCQDVNECANSSLNGCEKEAYCVNTMGSYDCKCPVGFIGNATKGSPCFPSPTASKALILGLSISLGSIALFIFIGGLYRVGQKRKEAKEREGNFDRNGGKLLEKQLLSTSSSGIGGTKIFSKAELEKATDNFNGSRVLGRGGQGIVFKGMLSDGTIVAIKKSRKDDENPDISTNQFINEVVIMSKINHRHVVKVIGVCLETKVPWLVYEFVPNGTLEQHIHNPTEEFHITWKMRFQIALDSAGALAYLHSSSDTPTYHRDIKSSNILLDEKYRAKVSDFGISKNISMEQTHVTTAVQGTYGYLDPEYYQVGQFTDKSDVYSFGAVLLELLTSKRPISTNKAYDSQSLVAVFLKLTAVGSDELYHILDTEVLKECPKGDMETLINLTKRCLSMHGRERPTMKEVAMTLEMIKAREDQVLSHSKPDEYVWSKDQIHITMGDEGPFTSSTSASLI